MQTAGGARRWDRTPNLNLALPLVVSLAVALIAAAAPSASVSAAPSVVPSAPAPVPAAPDANPAEAVIAAAERYVGVPYRLGREGPELFDCSGLVFRAFSDAGQLSRIGGSRRRAAGYMRWFAAQGLMTTDEQAAERGDLVIYNDGSHIGIYLGEGKALSALISGVAIHPLHGITVAVTGFLKVDWTGKGRGGRPLADVPLGSLADDPPELPAALVPPLAWLDAQAEEEVEEPLAAGVERTDMRTANSRTFEARDGTLTTEFFARPIFYRSDGSSEWQPIDLRLTSDGRAGARVESSPVAISLSNANNEAGFLELVAGEQALRLHVPRGATPRRTSAAPEISADGRYADYTDFLRGGIGLRVFPRADGAKAFLVLAREPRSNQFSFALDAAGLTPLPTADGGLALHDADGALVGRIPRPLTLDSSDMDGSGGGVAATATTLALAEEGALPLINLTVEREYLADAAYPVYIDLTITDFPAAPSGGGTTFASNLHAGANFSTYQRPESPGHYELWLGRQPGTRSYNEVYLGFAGVHEALVGADVKAAWLHLYPYWQHAEDPRPTWAERVAEEWHPAAVTWDLRPATDAELGRFESAAGEWSELDLTNHVREVVEGLVDDHGLMLHANDIGRRGWKRIVAHGGSGSANLEPRLVVRWSGLRPHALDAGAETATTGQLSWSHPGIAPAQTRFRVEVSADGFRSIAAESGIVKGDDGGATAWTIPDGTLAAGVEYSWRVRVKYGRGTPWSSWSEAATFRFGDALAPESVSELDAEGLSD